MAKKKNTKQEQVGNPALDIGQDVDNETGTEVELSLEELIATGKPQRERGLASAEVYRDRFGIVVDASAEGGQFSQNLAEIVRPFVERAPTYKLESAFETLMCRLRFLSKIGSEEQASELADRDYHFIDAIEAFYKRELDPAVERARAHGNWSFRYCRTFDLELVPCDSAGNLITKEERVLKDLREQYKQIQAAREEIDAKRDEWLHEQAEPLLDELEEQLSDISMPEEVRLEVEKFREQLRADAYGFSKLIDANEAKDIFELGYRRFQTLAQEGELGYPLSRFYVHSEDEVGPWDLISTLTTMGDQFSKLAENMQPAVQSFLDFVVAANHHNKELFPTLDDKQTFAKHLQALLDRLGLAVESPAGIPSRLEGFRCDNNPGGGFRFRHPDGGSEPAGPPLAALPLVARPPQKLAKNPFSDPTPSSISVALARLRTELDHVSAEAQSIVQTFLDSLVEATAKNPKLFPTLEDKKEFAKGLQAALDHVGLTILTSKGNPGRLDAYPAGGTQGGGFRLQATPSKNTENLRLPLKRPLVVAPKQLTDASSQPRSQ